MAPVSITEAVLVFSLGVVLVYVSRITLSLLHRYRTPIRHLQGPPSTSLLRGNLRPVETEVEVYHPWLKEYGRTIVLRGPLQIPILFSTDMRTINHVLTHSMVYHRPEELQMNFQRLLGRGLLVVEGEEHRHQRRVMNPGFGPGQIRDLTEIFLEKANELCAYWNGIISVQGGTARMNAMEGLSKMTLDVIGLAGFNYHFDALDPERPTNELNRAFHELFKLGPPPPGLKRYLPTFLVPSRQKRLRQVAEAKTIMQRISRQIVAEKKASIMQEFREKRSDHVEKNDMRGRDLITLLIKANMAMDIPDSQRMTDDEVLAQIPTFLIAGHETTSTGTTWCLLALTDAPRVQQKLREEVLAVDTDMPSMEELQALPYLDMVIRETLRLHAPVSAVVRSAVADDVLPVSEPLIDRHGNTIDEVPVTKGTTMIIPIRALHTSPEIWGDDAMEFRPERWENPPEAISGMPGVWGHLLTFIGGPHACIGYRFSVIEMKAIVFSLVRAFEFELAVPRDDIIVLSGALVKRPIVRGERSKGPQLPLIVRPHKRT